MRAIVLSKSSVIYKTDKDIPQLTSQCNVLVKVCYAGICRTDIGIVKGIVPAKEGVVLGHEFCGEIVGFLNGECEMDSWRVGDVVSATSTEPWMSPQTEIFVFWKAKSSNASPLWSYR